MELSTRLGVALRRPRTQVLSQNDAWLGRPLNSLFGQPPQLWKTCIDLCMLLQQDWFQGHQTREAKQKHLVDTLALDGPAMPLPLQGQGGDQALDLGRFAVLLAILLLHSPVCVDVLPHIIILAEVEELADLGCPLGAALAWLLCVCQPGDLTETCDHSNIIRCSALVQGASLVQFVEQVFCRL